MKRHTDFLMISYDSIPNECILTDMDNNDSYNRYVHPYLTLKAKTRNAQYKQYYIIKLCLCQFTIHAEIVDIRYPSKTIITLYDHQPRLFIPLYIGFFIRPFITMNLNKFKVLILSFGNTATNQTNRKCRSLLLFLVNKGYSYYEPFVKKTYIKEYRFT